MADKPDKEDRSPNRSNGRDAKGHFALGNAGGPGNPQPRRRQVLNAAFLEAVTKEDIILAARVLVTEALGGDVQALKLLFDRALGKIPDVVDSTDLETRARALNELVLAMRMAGGDAATDQVDPA